MGRLSVRIVVAFLAWLAGAEAGQVGQLVVGSGCQPAIRFGLKLVPPHRYAGFLDLTFRFPCPADVEERAGRRPDTQVGGQPSSTRHASGRPPAAARPFSVRR